MASSLEVSAEYALQSISFEPGEILQPNDLDMSKTNALYLRKFIGSGPQRPFLNVIA